MVVAGQQAGTSDQGCSGALAAGGDPAVASDGRAVISQPAQRVAGVEQGRRVGVLGCEAVVKRDHGQGRKVGEPRAHVVDIGRGAADETAAMQP